MDLWGFVRHHSLILWISSSGFTYTPATYFKAVPNDSSIYDNLYYVPQGLKQVGKTGYSSYTTVSTKTLQNVTKKFEPS
jgi:hypothetical protein